MCSPKSDCKKAIISFACLVYRQPRLFLLDEPLSNLAALNQKVPLLFDLRHTLFFDPASETAIV